MLLLHKKEIDPTTVSKGKDYIVIQQFNSLEAEPHTYPLEDEGTDDRV